MSFDEEYRENPSRFRNTTVGWFHRFCKHCGRITVHNQYGCCLEYGCTENAFTDTDKEIK
jgi:hypothetical protein